MDFDFKKALEILNRTPQVLHSLLSDLSFEWYNENEGGDSWSPYDVMGHLIHCEKTDWIPRAKIILSNAAEKTFIPFDRYAQFNVSEKKSLEQLLDEFQSLRIENLKTLEALNLTDIDLAKRGVHPELGEVNLKELLSTWVVHDLGHISQITRVMAKQYGSEVGPWKRYLGILNK